MAAGKICWSRDIRPRRYRRKSDCALLLGAFQAQDDVHFVTQGPIMNFMS